MTDKTIAGVLRRATQTLSHTSPSPQADARLLLCHVLQQNNTYLYTWSDKALEPAQLEQFESLIKRRIGGEPVAYITGERGFWSFSLKTNDSTLIPREETECLVECALEKVTARQAKVLDLGTGTGAIALALAVEQPQWQVYACDYNADAVALAQENAKDLEIDNFNVCQSDWFGAFTAHKNSFDLIVSNPPYIAPDDPHLVQGDLRFEPVKALAAADDGFSDIYHIIDSARDYLKAGGLLMLEHGFEQAERVRMCFVHHGYVDVATKQDLAALDRFTLAFYRP